MGGNSLGGDAACKAAAYCTHGEFDPHPTHYAGMGNLVKPLD